MFPDSKIAAKISLGRNKLAYIVNHGIAPYVRKMITDDMASEPFSLQVDEVTSTSGHYLGIVARFIQPHSWQKKTVCLNFVQLTSRDAASIVTAVQGTMSETGLQGSALLSVMSDNFNAIQALSNDCGNYIPTW